MLGHMQIFPVLFWSLSEEVTLGSYVDSGQTGLKVCVTYSYIVFYEEFSGTESCVGISLSLETFKFRLGGALGNLLSL